MNSNIVSSSFRDPSGFVFLLEGVFYRQINESYRDNYESLISSNLYQNLVDSELLISHKEVDLKNLKDPDAYKYLQPDPIAFISYPYEWSFSQLKDAALATLSIQKTALKYGMSLKDANAYNIQFHKGKPILIDTLSFEKYKEGHPWSAYQQFCRFFLGPLALMAKVDIKLNHLLKNFIEGIPLELASALLPWRTNLNPSLLMHVHLHAKYQKRYENSQSKIKRNGKFNIKSLLGMIDNLESFLKSLHLKLDLGHWAEYYSNTHSNSYTENKKELVEDFLNIVAPQTVWDLGANIGEFSRIASNKKISTISFDLDPACVEINYRQVVEKQEKNILPLLLDLNNPSPDIGWANKERMSLSSRGPADLILALAIVHHLAISNNVPFGKIAEFFNQISRSIIIEFIPRSDPMAQGLLASREDIFNNYNQGQFEKEFCRFFKIERSKSINGSERTLYLMTKR
jgi:hypothetical protein